MTIRGNETRSGFPKAVWWLVLAWVVVAIATVLWGLPNEQDELTDRAETALRGSGLTVEFDGRDATIAGTATGLKTVDDAAETVRQLRGVRRVDAAAAQNEEPTPQATATTTTTTTTTTVPPTTTTEAIATSPPSFTAIYSDPTVALRGTMPDRGTVDAIVSAAEARYGADNVDNQMVVGDSIESPAYLPDLPSVFDLTDGLNPWNITVDQDALILEGVGPDQTTIDTATAGFGELATNFEQADSVLELDAGAVAASLTGLLAEGANFETGSAQLSADATERLDNVIEILVTNPSVVLTVAGHTDDRGDNAANQTLSEDRAQSVVDYLVAGGIGSERLSAIGYGEDEPIADNETTEGRAMNRRIEFVVNEGDGS